MLWVQVGDLLKACERSQGAIALEVSATAGPRLGEWEMLWHDSA
jgi:hypothetical protein